MSQDSNETNLNNQNTDEEDKSLSLSSLPSRRTSRNVSRETKDSSDAKKNTAESKKDELISTDNSAKENKKSQTEIKEQENSNDNDQLQDDNKKDEVESVESIEEKNSSLNSDIDIDSKKIISNIKKATKKNKSGLICICLAVIIVILVIMIFLVFSKDEKTNSISKYLDGLRTQNITECNVEQVNFFFKSYFDALAAGNTTLIEGLYDDPTNANITTAVSDIVENFSNIKVYVTAGLNENEIVAFVYNELKFRNIETLAPSVDTFYIVFNEEENSLKIMTSMYTDPDIIKFINVVAKKEPVRTLLTDTNEKLSQALEADKELKNLYAIMQSMSENAEGEQPVK